MTFYSKTNVLVTGGASFIGSHLVGELLRRGATVTVVDDLSSGSLANLSDVIDDIAFIQNDLREYEACERSTRSSDVVFHLANVHGGRGFIDTHPADISQNLVIDGNMLRASHRNGVKRFCYASSACVYPTTIQGRDGAMRVRYLSEGMADPFKRDCALADREYGWGKLMGEMALSAYHRQHGLKGVACRFFTVYGPRQNESHAVIAFIAKALIAQDPFEIWGSGHQDRSFTYVSDAVEGLLRAGERIEDCRAVNIGTDEIVQVTDAAKTVCDILGHRPGEFFFDMTKPEGVHARAASVANQIEWLGWRPEVRFRDGVRKTVAWYSGQADIDELKQTLPVRLFER